MSVREDKRFGEFLQRCITPSLPGLTWQSMSARGVRRLRKNGARSTMVMDARVKPGHDTTDIMCLNWVHHSMMSFGHGKLLGLYPHKPATEHALCRRHE